MTEESNKSRDFDQIVADGIRLLESIARYYGPERSIEVWEKMGEAMGKDLQGQVFFAMLTGQGGHRIHIERGNCNQAVAAIKTIRYGTGLGLKEAKDAYDATISGPVVLDLSDATEVQRKHTINELRHIGMRVL